MLIHLPCNFDSIQLETTVAMLIDNGGKDVDLSDDEDFLGGNSDGNVEFDKDEDGEDCAPGLCNPVV